MKNAEAITILAITTGIGAFVGVTHELHEQATAASRAITAEACEAYDANDNVTKLTLDCLKNGWVQGSDPVTITDMNAKEPEKLLTGYVLAERSRAHHFDPEAAGWLGVLGLAGGVWFIVKGDSYQRETTTADASTN